MSRYGRRKRGWYIGNLYINPTAQYTTTIVCAVIFAGFIFSGFLLFRYTDTDDLVSRGKRLMAEGKVALALKTFQTLVSNHPEHYEGHILLGQAYLDLGDRQKAEQEFRAATALKSDSISGQESIVAMSKLSIARKEFELAENKLLKAYKDMPQDPSLKQALFELYERWADDAVETHQDYALGIAKYERALRYVSEYHYEDKIKEKLIENITVYTDQLNDKRNFSEAVYMLKKSLRYRYLPDTLIEIAETYEKNKNTDEAIAWYRRAFDADPAIISIKLSNMLIRKGQELVEAKKPEEAEKYFAEAKKISTTANVPMDVVYPVKAKNIKVSSNPDFATGEFFPEVQMTLENGGNRPLSFLVVRATFYSTEKLLGETQQVVVNLDQPLSPKGKNGSSKSFTLAPEEKYNMSNLSDKKDLRVKIAIAYSQDASTQWKDIAIQETYVKRSIAVSTRRGNPSTEASEADTPSDH
jgi:tetratricopeptide (TPR) repeat protein